MRRSAQKPLYILLEVVRANGPYVLGDRVYAKAGYAANLVTGQCAAFEIIQDRDPSRTRIEPWWRFIPVHPRNWQYFPSHSHRLQFAPESYERQRDWLGQQRVA